MCVHTCAHAGDRGTFREVLTEEMSKEASPPATFLLVLKFTDGLGTEPCVLYLKITRPAFSQWSETWFIFKR